MIFSVDGHHLAFYMTEYNCTSVFCNQKQGSTKNVNANLSGNLYGDTYFFSLARFALSAFKTLKYGIVQSGTSTIHHIVLLC